MILCFILGPGCTLSRLLRNGERPFPAPVLFRNSWFQCTFYTTLITTWQLQWQVTQRVSHSSLK